MTWLFKIAGTIFGYLYGGPMFALAGLILGHSIDAGLHVKFQKKKTNHNIKLHTQYQYNFALLTNSISLIAKLIKSDGRVNKRELVAAEEFMHNVLGLNPDAQKFAKQIFNDAKDSNITPQIFAAQFYDLTHKQPEMLEAMIDALFRIAIVDGPLQPQEEDLIRTSALIFHLSEDKLKSLRKRYVVEDLEKCYSLLGCKTKDSDQVIKKRYRKLVTDYHPDTIQAKNLPNEFIDLANNKFRDIQNAYEIVKRHRGLA